MTFAGNSIFGRQDAGVFPHQCPWGPLGRRKHAIVRFLLGRCQYVLHPISTAHNPTQDVLVPSVRLLRSLPVKRDRHGVTWFKRFTYLVTAQPDLFAKCRVGYRMSGRWNLINERRVHLKQIQVQERKWALKPPILCMESRGFQRARRSCYRPPNEPAKYADTARGGTQAGLRYPPADCRSKAASRASR